MWLSLLVESDATKRQDAEALLLVLRQFTPTQYQEIGVSYAPNIHLDQMTHLVDMKSDDWIYDLYEFLSHNGIAVIDLADPASLAGVEALAIKD